MNTRLQLFITSQGITQSQLADIVNVSPASISNILTGKNKPAYDFIHNILAKYPKLNAEWLLMGKGKMFKDDDSTTPPQEQFVPEATTVVPEKGPFGYEQLIFPEVMQNTQASADIKTVISEEKRDDCASQECSQHSSKTSYDTEQSTDNQRKAIRITVFYDDNSYKDIEL